MGLKCGRGRAVPGRWRVDGETVGRVAARGNRGDVGGSELNEGPDGVLVRGEVSDALGDIDDEEVDPDDE